MLIQNKNLKKSWNWSRTETRGGESEAEEQNDGAIGQTSGNEMKNCET